MKLLELVRLYQNYARNDCVKHGRSTSTRWKIIASTNYLLEVEVRGDALLGREPTGSASLAEDLPQLNLLSVDLPGPGGEPVRRLAEVDVAELTADDLADYLRHLAGKVHDRGRLKGQAWTMKHINDCRGVVLRIFKWAKARRDIGVDAELVAELKQCEPLQGGKTKARRSVKLTAADRDIAFELIEYCRKSAAGMKGRTAYQRDRRRRRRLLAIAFELLWELGCRPQEIVLLKPCEVVADPKQDGGWLYLPGEWKTEHEAADGERRIMVVSRRAKELIDEAVVQRRTDGNQMLLASADDYDPRARLFLWAAEHPYNAVNGFYLAVKRNLRAAGLPHLTNLQIRHAFGTRSAAVNLEGTRVQMGHRSVQTTMKYLDTDGVAVRSLFDQLDGRGGPTPPAGPDPAAPRRTGTDDRDEPPFRLRLVGG